MAHTRVLFLILLSSSQKICGLGIVSLWYRVQSAGIHTARVTMVPKQSTSQLKHLHLNGHKKILVSIWRLTYDETNITCYQKTIIPVVSRYTSTKRSCNLLKLFKIIWEYSLLFSFTHSLRFLPYFTFSDPSPTKFSYTQPIQHTLNFYYTELCQQLCADTSISPSHLRPALIGEREAIFIWKYPTFTIQHYLFKVGYHLSYGIPPPSFTAQLLSSP